MNTNKNIEKTCVHGVEIVSYLYDEMPEPGRKVFESHLLNCTACTDEFAGLSLARLDVYEWNSHEFAALPTPFIAIPYENTDQVSWFESWFGPIFSAPKWAAGGVFGAAALVFGFVLFPSGNTEDNISISEVKTIQMPAAVHDEPSSTAVENNKQIAEVKLPNLLNTNKDKRAVAERVRASELFARKRKIIERVTAVKTKNTRPSTPLNAPRLTNFEDEDDTTLRLADLVADRNTDQ